MPSCAHGGDKARGLAADAGEAVHGAACSTRLQRPGTTQVTLPQLIQSQMLDRDSLTKLSAGDQRDRAAPTPCRMLAFCAIHHAEPSAHRLKDPARST